MKRTIEELSRKSREKESQLKKKFHTFQQEISEASKKILKKNQTFCHFQLLKNPTVS